MTQEIVITVVLISMFLFKADCFRCLTCTQFRNECSEDFVDSNQKIGNEPCNGRCYTRKTASNVISRGCDMGFWYADNEKIPDNGCKVREDGDMWCWCNTFDFCNKDSIEASLMRTSTIISALIVQSETTTVVAVTEPTVIIYEGCSIDPCQNSGTCYSNHFYPNFFICVCTPHWTDKICSTPTDENSKSLEEYLQSIMKNNFDVYQITDDEGEGIVEEEIEDENEDDNVETINLDEVDQQTESIVSPEIDD